jgi:uncharacterized protein DUF3311
VNRKSLCRVLLAIPVVAALLPWTFDRRTPALAGIPFFYWYQLLLVPIGSMFVWLVLALEGDLGAKNHPGDQ